MTKSIFQAIHPIFEQELIYFSIDKAIYKGIYFNRPVIVGNDICFGEGFSQLRPKEELRIAFCHGMGAGKDLQFIFVENNANELK